MAKQRRTKITDESADRKYFIVTPQLVWALSRDTYDYTLWNVIKMIAGDHGECTLSTDDLAILAMMSTGKASNCRAYLLKIGLLEGEIEKDPGYPQPVWHLRIPDLWPRNMAWREALGHKLKDRIKLKRQQKAKRKKSLHQVKPSPGEGGTPPGEGGTPPGEGGTPPHETKDILKGEPKEEPKGSQQHIFVTPEGIQVQV